MKGVGLGVYVMIGFYRRWRRGMGWNKLERVGRATGMVGWDGAGGCRAGLSGV